MKQNQILSFLLALLFIQATSNAKALDESADARKLFATYCVNCHGKGDDVEGDVNLQALADDSKLIAQPELIEKIIDVLRDGSMPPEDEKQPSDKLKLEAIAGLGEVFQKSLKNQPYILTPIRRLNRFQYNNAVVDLLELDRDIFQMNERLMRRRNDYFRPASRKMPNEVRVSSRPLSKDIDNQRPEGFRGVAAFPQDKRAENGFDNRADHLTLSPLLMESFLTLSQTIVESPDLNPNECGTWDRLFSEPGKSSSEGRLETELRSKFKVQSTPSGSAVPQRLDPRNGVQWSRNHHLLWKCLAKDQELILRFKMDQPGKGIKLALTRAGDYGSFDVILNGKKLGSTIDLYSPRIDLSTHEFPEAELVKGKNEIKFRCAGKNSSSKRFYFGIDFLEVITREKNDEKRSETNQNDKDPLRERISWLLRRAFRKPVDPNTLNRFVAFAKLQIENGASTEETMRTVVGAVIGMPDFLYIHESEPSASKAGDSLRQKVTDFELASRLSQFFWSSIPDDNLLDLAEAGKLSDPEVLAGQIDRMLDDDKMSRFCENFPAQWLQLERLITSIPDKKKYPYFYIAGYRSSMHMMSEPLLLFETVFVEDRSVMDLIAPDFTWESGLLRQNYLGNSNGGKEVQVQVFRRVPVKDARRGGVITNAAVMTMTSTPVRTQPITRGAWINTVIFNDPPEPPPADVPPLPETDKAELEKLTIRERLAVHRKRADCAGCHNKIDPLGFAMENFGPTGIWREKYENGRAVDASGILFNKHEFKTLEEFKGIIVKEKERFIRAFAAHLLSYALGRELGPADSPALDEIAKAAANENDSLRTVLKSIAQSQPFMHKR